MSQTNTPNKPKVDSVISNKKKKGIVFKDTVSSPYISKSINTISNEYSELILKSLKELTDNEIKKIKNKKVIKKEQFFKVRKEKKSLNKLNNRLKSIEKKKQFVLNDESLSKEDKDKEILRQNQLLNDFQKQKNDQQLILDSILKLNNVNNNNKEKEEGKDDDKENKNEDSNNNNNRLNQFWIGVNKITRELEKIPVHSPPTIRCIIVCPNPDIPILTSHLPIMAYMRRIPICLLPKEFSVPLSQCLGIPNTSLAMAIKEKKIDNDENFDESFEDFVKLSIEASKSINSLDFPWLPQKYTCAHLSEPIDVKYIPTSVIKESNKRMKF
ncbi:hypothetical protein ACTFIU_006940 [Dictyostelium citrinum]